MGFIRQPILFIDLDGVLADFVVSANAILGRPVRMDISKEEWKKIETVPNFWADLPLMPDAMKLWENVFSYDPYILTAPGGSSDAAKIKCAIQKKHWCEKSLPGFVAGRFITCRSSEKQYYATTRKLPNILVDDYDRNIKQWVEKGGFGILHTSTIDTLEKLRGLKCGK